jgi:hypothetical protein
VNFENSLSNTYSKSSNPSQAGLPEVERTRGSIAATARSMTEKSHLPRPALSRLPCRRNRPPNGGPVLLSILTQNGA